MPTLPQPKVPPYLEGLCQRIQVGERGGQCGELQSLRAAQGSSVCKVSNQFLELLGTACRDLTGSGTDEGGTHGGNIGPRQKG